MKRLFALLLALSLVLPMVPVTTLADETKPPEVTLEQLPETEAPAAEVPETEVPATDAPVTTPSTEVTTPPTETEPPETTTATLPEVTETTPETEAPETTEVTEETTETTETTEATEETLSLLDEGETGGECGDNLTWTFDESSNTLTISGTGAMWDYNNSGAGETTAPWRDLSFTTLVLEDGITSIGDCAFYLRSSICCDLGKL